ncbi:MAG: hypothetical protein JWM85_2121 [Acidimicrobiaceae bacterium]|nr:hypothetical protein [Acidimicrobiaceae bacterium]
MSRNVTIDLDQPDDVLRLWAEARRVSEHRKVEPALRIDLVRLAIAADPAVSDEVLAALDRVTPAAVLEAYFAELVPDRSTIGAYRV